MKTNLVHDDRLSGLSIVGHGDGFETVRTRVSATVLLFRFRQYQKLFVCSKTYSRVQSDDLDKIGILIFNEKGCEAKIYARSHWEHYTFRKHH